MGKKRRNRKELRVEKERNEGVEPSSTITPATKGRGRGKRLLY